MIISNRNFHNLVLATWIGETKFYRWSTTCSKYLLALYGIKLNHSTRLLEDKLGSLAKSLPESLGFLPSCLAVRLWLRRQSLQSQTSACERMCLRSKWLTYSTIHNRWVAQPPKHSMCQALLIIWTDLRYLRPNCVSFTSYWYVETSLHAKIRCWNKASGITTPVGGCNDKFLIMLKFTILINDNILPVEV